MAGADVPRFLKKSTTELTTGLSRGIEMTPGSFLGAGELSDRPMISWMPCPLNCQVADAPP